jgi:hypothetical protein
MLPLDFEGSLKAIQDKQNEVIFSMYPFGKNPLAPCERRELACDPHTRRLVTNNAVLSVEALADNLRVDRCCRSDASTSPIHSIRLIDILTKAPAVKGKVESPPAESEHERPNKPWREGPIGILGSLLLVMIVMILIHGDSSYRLIL